MQETEKPKEKSCKGFTLPSHLSLILWWAWNKETGKRHKIPTFDVPALDTAHWHIEQVHEYRLVYADKHNMRTVRLTQSVAERVQQRGVGRWIIKRML